MAVPELRGKRALVLGVETPTGRALALALAEAGAEVAAVAATTDAEAAFAAQRLGRCLAERGRRPLAQAIDATNDMAVRVMSRQVVKALGGLDLLFFSAALGERTAAAFALACRYGAREMARSRGGAIVALGTDVDALPMAREYAAQGVRVNAVLHPPSREGPPGAIAEALRLASDATARVTGLVCRLEGG